MRTPMWTLLLVACGGQADRAPAFENERSYTQDEEGTALPAPVAEAPSGGMKARAKKSVDLRGASEEDKRDKGRQGTGEAEAPAARSWFPETFLFEPLVVTDDGGRAQVPVRVPDRLTTWRVLGLAHSRAGGVAGDLTSFEGTLPTYVEPVLPRSLVAGDRVRLPVRVVNTTDTAVRSRLDLRAGAAGGSAETLTVPAHGRVIRWLNLHPTRSGVLTVSARLGDEDAVERTISVRPSGRPIDQSRGGTLAAPRELTLTQGGAEGQVRLVVFPGALALLRGELAEAQAREGEAEAAYALLLSGRAPQLFDALGAPELADAEALRALRLVATQRALRAARAPDVAQAALLTEAALAHPDDPVLSRLGERLQAQLVREQRPDGTFGGGTGWTLQRMLVATAEAVQAVQAGAELPNSPAPAVTLRASAAVERLPINDAYTAAMVLGAGMASGEQQERLRALVRAAITIQSDGSRAMSVPDGTVRADGRTPSAAEATAVAVLALQDDPQADPWLPDLGARLLSAYRPGMGWGDGHANLVCLRAVLGLFDQPMPEEVDITLSMDGQVVAERALDRDALRELAVLEAPIAGAGVHTWKIEADPALPGLGFQLGTRSWKPWRPVSAAGLELQVSPPAGLRVGQPAHLRLRAAAPAGRPLHLSQGLAAGVQVDEDGLQAQVDEGTLSGFNVTTQAVLLDLPALRPSQTADVDLTLIPTLAGALLPGATRLWAGNAEGHATVVPPVRWRIGE